MPDKWPLANGNWSSAANWNGGALPVDGDDIYLDNRTITLDQTVNLPNARLLSTQRTGGTAGGTLNLSGSLNVTLLAVLTGSSSPITIPGNYSGTISIATVNGSSTTSSIPGINVTAGIHSFTLSGCSFVGNSSGTNRVGLWLGGGSGTITFINCTATGGGSSGVIVNGGSQTLTGTLHLVNTASSSIAAINITTNATLATLSGTCTANGFPALMQVQSGSAATYTCTSFTWGASLVNSAQAVFQFSSSTTTNVLTLPSITMPNLASGPYLVSVGTVGCKVSVYGDITGGIGATGAYVFLITNGTIERFGEDISGDGPGANALAVITANSNCFYIVDKIRCSATGVLMLPYGPGVRFKSTSRIIARDAAGSSVTIQGPSALVDLPIPANVRQGVTYNNGTQVGTLAAILTLADVRTAIGLASANLDTQLSSMPANVRSALGMASGNLDTQIAGIPTANWSFATRTITAGGLTQADVRAAVGLSAANLDDQLASLGSSLVTIGSYVDTEVAAIKVKTDLLPSTAIGPQLDRIEAKTGLLGSASVSVLSMVTPTGEINGPILIGDDYLEVNGRAFEWTVPAVPGVNVATCSFWFGGKPTFGGSGWLVQGEVSDAGGGNWKLSADLPRASTGVLVEGQYRWSGEIRDASGNEITRIKSASQRYVEVAAKQT